MDSNEHKAVTGTDTNKAFSDKDQAGIYFGLSEVDKSLKALQEASIMNKGDRAEKVILATRATLGQLASANHALFNDLTRLRGELDHIRKNGFGG